VLRWLEYPHFVASLLAMLIPFAAVPAYLSLTQGYSVPERARIAVLAASTAAIVLVIATLIGPLILGGLGVSIGSLWVGGGLVLLLLALSMPNPDNGPVRRASANTPSGAAAALGVPLLAGPGPMSSVMAEMHHGAGAFQAAAVVLCVMTTCVTVWAILRFAEPIGDRIAQSGFDILSRLFGVLLAAMAARSSPRACGHCSPSSGDAPPRRRAA